MTRAGLSLLVRSPTRSAIVALPERGTLVLGRDSRCTVSIDDARISRMHAEVRVDGDVHFVDLGSQNGSFLHGARLPASVPAVLRVGDAVVLGDTVVVLRHEERAGNAPVILDHEAFIAGLEAQCSLGAQASHGGAAFALVRIRPRSQLSELKTMSRAAPAAIAQALLKAYLVASYAPAEYELILADATPEQAQAFVASLAQPGSPFEATLAMYPRDGRTAEALLERTSFALDEVPSNRPAANAVAIGAQARLDLMIEPIAAGEISVLIVGETGVGKEVLARRIHERSARAKEPLLSINCAAFSDALLESELFGHEKGAFTGAVAAKPGLLESVNGGTVLLDEIGDMPLAMQAKLLRVLEQREVTRVGALRPKPIDVRFIAATNRDLEDDSSQGRFRQDLYFRLAGVTLAIPPLRERTDEVEPLARSFAERVARSAKRDHVPELSPEALEQLRAYHWPGNIRELRNVIERAVLLCTAGPITTQHLPVDRMRNPLPKGAATLAPPRPSALDPELQRVSDALEQTGGNQREAAKRLGMARGTLIKRMEQLGLARPRKR